MRSLRSRLLLGVGIATLAVLVASSIAVYVLMRASLLAEFDAALGAKARALAALVEHEDADDEEGLGLDDVPQSVQAAIRERVGGGTVRELERKRLRGRIIYEVEAYVDGKEMEFTVEADGDAARPRGSKVRLELSEDSFPEFHGGPRPEYLQLTSLDGAVITRSPSLGEAALDGEAGPLERPRCLSATLPDGRRGRIASVRFAPRREHGDEAGSAEVTLAVARDTADIDDTLGRLRWLLIAVCGVATVVAAVALGWIVTAGLRPVAQVAGAIERVGADDLSARVAAGRAPQELLPVVDRLNDLLARLEAAFERERTFSGDVAHELRTPLAGLRTTLEVALRGPGDAASSGEALRDSLAISCQMHAMVENLMAMARCEAGQMDVACQPVDVAAFARECWAAVEARAAERELDVAWEMQEPCTAQADPETLRLILHNLLDNAVTYCDAGGRVRIGLRAEEDRATLTVANSGSRLDADQAAHVFDRFWRGDAARSDVGAHCGLGLPLCQRLAALLGADMAATSSAGGDFTVTLTLGLPY